MNILLLYPEMPETFWSMKHLMKILGKKSSYPPLGLLTVASLLPENWNKKLIDLNLTPARKKDIEWADLVFISAMNVQEPSVKEAIEFCKKYNAKIVAGGPLFTHEYEKFPDVDYFVLNEAEITLPLFLDDLKNGTPERFYKTNEFPDVTKSPMPEWNLVDINKYAYAIVQYSRGCPYMCDFCDVTALFGRRPRTKTKEQIISELDKILKLGKPELILFADDNLIGNRRDLKNNLLPALIEWRKKNKTAPGFATQVTVNLADDEEMMQQMVDAGFRHIFVGIESPEADSLEACKKTQNLRRDLLENVKKLQRFGFIVTGGFIVGFDTDKESIFESQVKFIQESGIVIATVNVLKAPPGTELHDRLQKEDRLIEPFDFDENKTNIITKMDPGILYNGYKYILDNIYSPELVYQRAKVFLDGYGDHKSQTPIQKSAKLIDVIIILRLIFYTGVFGSERKYFWKLIFETWKTKKKNIDQAYFFSALLYQFKMLHNKFLNSYKEMNIS
ncbi:MAG TPA: B12-binding domain-containing radical SAM protein [Ignavibacteriaceae bacterium]|nr:B12-binding domain-containing radical SAM protein [Ignavibacteriaceae bacterium]